MFLYTVYGKDGKYAGARNFRKGFLVFILKRENKKSKISKKYICTNGI